MAQINKPTDYFDTLTWSGDNTSPRSLTGLDFQPDWVWIKRRSSAKDHGLFDSVRGGTKKLESNSTDAEINGDNGQISSFNSDGFSVITGTADNSGVNATSSTYVGWNWLAGGTASSNTDGSITSTVSANTTSGFSIVSYTGNATAGATVGHGLGVVPKMIIIKIRSGVSEVQWVVYHVSTGNTKALYLNTTTAPVTVTGFFNNTTPSSTVFTLGTDTATNSSGNPMIAYCFAEKKAFSKFGSYTGNGNDDGAFVYTGFKPAWIMVKDTTNASEWNIYDIKRNQFNVTNLELEANTSDAEANISGREIDILSNGFKLRGTSGFTNFSGSNYIYMAFAEQPLVGTNNIPATAR